MATASKDNKAAAAPQNRGDIAGAIAAKFNLPQSQADLITKEYEAAIVRALASGQEVRLMGFGTFKVSARSARTARNPQTGGTIKVAARKVPRFTPGKAVKDAVNGVKSGGAKAGAKATASKSAAGAKSGGAKGGAAAKAAPAKATAAKGGATKGGAAKGKKK